MSYTGPHAVTPSPANAVAVSNNDVNTSAIGRRKKVHIVGLLQSFFGRRALRSRPIRDRNAMIN
jgi:hypothetical protein